MKTLYVSSSVRKNMTIYGTETDITKHQPELAGYLPVFHTEQDAKEFDPWKECFSITVKPKEEVEE